MQNPVWSDRSGNGISVPLEALNVAVFYTDFAAGSHAMRFFARLVDCLHDDFLLTLSVWRLEAEGGQEKVQKAAAAAALADVILLGLHENGGLPFAARRWVREVALRRAGRPGVLATLVVPEEGAWPTALHRVRPAAVSRMEFLAAETPRAHAVPVPGAAGRQEKLARGLARAFGGEGGAVGGTRG